MGHGGGIIKRQLHGVLLFALAAVVCTLPLVGAVDNQNLGTSTIISSEKNTVSANVNSASSSKAEVNAAYKKTYKKTYKRSSTRYKKTYRYGKYRYAKAAYKTTYRTSYRGGAYTSGKGVGDCWTNSEYLYNQLVSSGQNARILQYRNSYVSNHRSVQVYQNGAWVDYDYRGNGYSWGYYAQASKPGVKVIKSSI